MQQSKSCLSLRVLPGWSHSRVRPVFTLLSPSPFSIAVGRRFCSGPPGVQWQHRQVSADVELSARLAWVASSGGGHLRQVILSSVLRPHIYTMIPRPVVAAASSTHSTALAAALVRMMTTRSQRRALFHSHIYIYTHI